MRYGKLHYKLSDIGMAIHVVLVQGLRVLVQGFELQVSSLVLRSPERL